MADSTPPLQLGASHAILDSSCEFCGVSQTPRWFRNNEGFVFYSSRPSLARVPNTNSFYGMQVVGLIAKPSQINFLVSSPRGPTHSHTDESTEKPYSMHHLVIFLSSCSVKYVASLANLYHLLFCLHVLYQEWDGGGGRPSVQLNKRNTK